MNLIAMILAVQSLPSPAGVAWEAFGPPQAGVTNTLDPASIAREGDRVSVRVRAVRAQAAPDGMSIGIAAFTIDCRARTATLQGVDLYRADGTFGRSMDGEEEAMPVTGDPVQRALFERVCRTGG